MSARMTDQRRYKGKIGVPNSGRKPHNNYRGYVCERKSKHPKLPGHFIVLDAKDGGDWAFGGSELRWAVMYEPNIWETYRPATIVCMPTKISAIELMKAAASGSDECDFGQNDDEGE